MEFFLVLLFVGILLVVLPILAIVWAGLAKREVARLNKRVDRLSAELERVRVWTGQGSVETPPESTQAKPAAPATAQEPASAPDKPAVKQSLPPVISTPLETADPKAGESHIEPLQIQAEAPKTGEKSKPAPAQTDGKAAQKQQPIALATRTKDAPKTKQAEVAAGGAPALNTPVSGPRPEPAEVAAKTLDKQVMDSFEMRMGTHWFVRIGVVLVLTAFAFFAYYNRTLVFELPSAAKAVALYLLSFGMVGAGFWLPRKSEHLKNYGQVLAAGGMAGVYFTTYAAHLFDAVKLEIISSPVVAAVLLFFWGSFMIGLADRKKSEVMALFAISASYYSTYVPVIHPPEGAAIDSTWFVLFSNLVLAVASVFFLVRNRWIRMPYISMAASYAGYFLWKQVAGAEWQVIELETVRIDHQALMPGIVFLVSSWVIYTLAVFLSRHREFTDGQRASFLSANNAALFGFLGIDMLHLHETHFWVLPAAQGAVLLALAAAAAHFLKQEHITRKSYLTQGLVLVTLGLMTYKMEEAFKGPILAAESVVLLYLGYRRDNRIIKGAAFLIAGIGAGWFLYDLVQADIVPVEETGSGHIWAGVAVGLFLTFNAWLVHSRVTHGADMLVRPAPGYFAVLGLGCWLVLTMDTGNRLFQEWLAPVLAGEAILLTTSIYWLRVRELVLFGQVFVLAGALAELARHISMVVSRGGDSEATKPLPLIMMLTVLGLMYWWQIGSSALRGKTESKPAIRPASLGFQAVYSLIFVILLGLWLDVNLDVDRGNWVWMGAALAVGLTGYAAMTSAWFLAGAAQLFMLLSGLVFLAHGILGAKVSGLTSLVPLAGFLSIATATLQFLKRFVKDKPPWHSPAEKACLFYRCIAAGLGIFWVMAFIPGEYRFLAFVGVALALFLWHGWDANRERLAFAALFVGCGLLNLLSQLVQDLPHTSQVASIGILLASQQIARRLEHRYQLPSGAHKILILQGGICAWALAWVWADGFLTLWWLLLAVGFFCAGLALRERWHRLVGLGFLACSLLSLVRVVLELPTQWQIASFFFSGLVFLGLGFVYNKFKEQIRKVL